MAVKAAKPLRKVKKDSSSESSESSEDDSSGDDSSSSSEEEEKLIGKRGAQRKLPIGYKKKGPAPAKKGPAVKP